MRTSACVIAAVAAFAAWGPASAQSETGGGVSPLGVSSP